MHTQQLARVATQLSVAAVAAEPDLLVKEEKLMDLEKVVTEVTG